MSDEQHSWKVVKSFNGWNVEHSGPCRMRFQPDQYGKVKAIYRFIAPGVAPLDFDELRYRVRDVPARLNGKRFGNSHSETRRNVCCEYAAELNGEAQ